MKVVYESAMKPHDYRAECSHCDWWESADTWGDVGRRAREHLRDADLDSDHDEAIVSVRRVVGHFLNELETSRWQS